MKDVFARTAIKNEKLMRQYRYSALEARIPVEFDCPVCGHITLAKWIDVPTPLLFMVGNKYCYSCGKTFENTGKITYKEVFPIGKEGDE